jgi:hypothetical protein
MGKKKNEVQSEEAQSNEPQVQSKEAQKEPEERVVVELNPVTGLRGYDFGDFGAIAGKRYRMDKSRYERYAKEKHSMNGKQVQVLVKV